MVRGGTFLNINLLLCQCRPSSKYSSFPIDQPSPPAFQNMYLQQKLQSSTSQPFPTPNLSFSVCLYTTLSGAHSTRISWKKFIGKKIWWNIANLCCLVLPAAVGVVCVVDAEAGAQQDRAVGCGEKWADYCYQLQWIWNRKLIWKYFGQSQQLLQIKVDNFSH